MTVCGIIACLNTSCVGGCIMRSYKERFMKHLKHLAEGQRTELWGSGMLNERGFRVASSDFEMTSRNLKIRDTPRLKLAMVG